MNVHGLATVHGPQFIWPISLPTSQQDLHGSSTPVISQGPHTLFLCIVVDIKVLLSIHKARAHKLKFNVMLLILYYVFAHHIYRCLKLAAFVSQIRFTCNKHILHCI